MVRLLLVLVVSSLVMAPSVGAAEPMRLVASDVEFFDADGGRYAVWGTRASDRLEVIDSRDDRRSSVPKPAGCAGAFPGGGGRLLGGTQFLLACGTDRDTGPQRALLVDVRTGTVRPLPRNLPGARRPAIIYWGAVGRRWVVAEALCTDSRGRRRGCEAWVDWRTGRSVTRFFSRRAQRVRDIDDPRLRPVCGSKGADRMEREVDTPHVIDRLHNRLVLRRCGRRSRRLAGGVDEAVIAGGRVLASREDLLFGWNGLGRRIGTWRVPRAGAIAQSDEVAPLVASHAVFAGVPSREDPRCEQDCPPLAYNVYEGRR